MKTSNNYNSLLMVFCDRLKSEFNALTKVLVAGDEAWLNDFYKKTADAKFKLLVRSKIEFADIGVNMFSRANLRRLEKLGVSVDPDVFKALAFQPSK